MKEPTSTPLVEDTRKCCQKATALRGVVPEESSPEEEVSGHQEREVSLSPILKEHHPEDELRLDLGQGIESNTNFSNKSYIQKSHRASKNNFKTNKNSKKIKCKY